MAAVVAAVLAGRYKMVRGGDASPSTSVDAELLMEQHEKQRLAYEAAIESLNSTIAAQNQYLMDSLLMKIDPYSETASTAELLIEAADGSKENVGNLLKFYEYALREGEYIESIAENLGSEEKYVKELIQVNSSASKEYGYIDDKGVTRIEIDAPEYIGAKGILQLKVIGSDAETTEAILTEMIHRAEKLQGEVSTSIENHKLSVLRQVTSEVIDMELLKT